MGVLREPDTGRELQLPTRCLIGRSRACDLVLGERQVSSQHAVLEWNGAAWEACDLGSRNGTYVHDKRRAAGERVLLRQGAELKFGRDSPTWVLADAGGPVLLAVHMTTGATVTATGNYLVLPDAQRPEFGVYQDTRGQWKLEAGGEQHDIEDRAVLTTSDGAWRVHLPILGEGTLTETVAPLLLTRLGLRFTYTREEEHVELCALDGPRRLELGARTHHYPLLLLARRRLADREAGVVEAEQGWIRQEDLLKLLRVEDNYLHISIHRARGQLAKLGVTDVAALIERRPATRHLRIGVARLELIPSSAAPPGGATE